MKRHEIDLDPESGGLRCPFLQCDEGTRSCEHPENCNPRWQEDGQKMFLMVDMGECPHEYRAPMDAQGRQKMMECAAPACPLRKGPIQIEGKARLKFAPCKEEPK